MTKTEVISIILSAFIGGSGFAGILMWLLRRYIEKRLEKAEIASVQRRKRRILAAEIEDELQHAYGRMFFWIYHWAKTGRKSAEFDIAFSALEAAEKKKKEFDRHITASKDAE